MELVPLVESDLPFVRDIYNYFTAHSMVVYFLDPIDVEEVRSFMPVGDPHYHSFIIRTDEGERAGFCFYHPWNTRAAYRVSVEITVYLAPGFEGRGLGPQVMAALEEDIRQNGYRNIVAIIDSGNGASAHMVEKCGYRRCGVIQNVAEKWGQKLSSLIYQKELLPEGSTHNS